MAFYILGVFLVALVSTSLIMHYGFDLLGYLPDPSKAVSLTDRTFFKIDYTFYLNIFFLLLSFVGLKYYFSMKSDHHHHGESSLSDKILFSLSLISYCWLGLGLVFHFL